jgi:hypothetical protein
MTEGERIYVVDRLEGDIVVLVGDDSGAVEMSASELPVEVGEGDYLRVPVAADGSEAWQRARIDEELREQRLGENRAVLDELKKRDPGGDVVL